MNRWLLLLLLSFACDSGAKSAPAAKDGASSPPPDPVDARAGETVAPIEAEWVVWFKPEGEAPRSRWYTKTAEGVTLTAERKTVVIGEGARWWQLRRADAKAEVFACPCVESEDDPRCEKTGEVTTLGLEALPMSGGDPVSLQPASTEAIYGDVDELGLSLRGGVGTRVFVETSDAGYYCGAHGFYGGAIHVRDPSSEVSPGWPALTLPDPMLQQAAVSEGMLEDYVECWNEGEVGMATFIRDIMKVVSVELSLDAGMLQLLWNTEADGPYVCTADYAFDGWVKSGLLPTAEPLGLAPPLPAGLQEAFSDVGDAEAVGWGAIDPGARESALAWFEGLPEPAWPKERSTQRAAAASPAPKAALSGRKLLERGRTLTRAGDHAGAVEALTEAIEADPSAPRPYAARCYAHLLAQSWKPARADCEKVLTMHPDDRFAASVHYNLGLIAQGQGRAADAKAAFETSLRLRENTTVRRALEALEAR